MSRIRQLDDHVAASVRGSQIIGSVGRAVEELVLNSIAGGGASSVSISLLNNDEIKINDDGKGINIDAMRLYIGTNYCSSGGEASEKGETLRSLASLCLEMKIVSRHAAADSRKQQALSNVNGKSLLESNRVIGIVQCEKVFRSGRVVSFNQSTDNNTTSSVLPKLNQLNSTKEKKTGTTITIRGLFHQHAVRRKHLTNQDGNSNSQDLAQVRACLRVLALSYPHVAFELASKGKVDCSYQTSISSSNNVSPSLKLKSRALIQRLCEVYPNDFTQDLSIELTLEESSSQVFGALCILEEDGDDNDVLRNRELEMICINGRVATQSNVLADVVLGQISFERGSKSNCSVHFFIHISTKSSELVIKDSIATNSVPHIDKLAKSLKKMISNTMMNSQQSIQPHDMRRTAADSQSVYTQNTSFSRPMVKGQHITSSFDTTSAAPRKRSTTKTTTANYPSSPFSSAFFTDTIQPPMKDNSNTNATKSTGEPDMSTNELSFEDAFLEQDDPTPKLTEDTETTSSNMDIDYNFDDQQDTSATSTVWTRQRIKGLERTIANLSPEVSASGSDGKSLTKEMLSNAQVIAQVELKFIIIKTACGVLCAVDQHAADERVALEKLESALSNQDLADDTIINLTKRSVKKSDILRATKLAPSKRIVLSQKDLSTVKHHYTLLQKWKFTFEEAEDKTLLITGLPSVCDRTAEVSDFLDFVRILGHSSGGTEIKPPFVKHVLASNACRYAIMFGDELTHDKCVELISSLSKCELCFICAHGRPSIIPLIDMNKDEKAHSTSEVKTGSKEVKDDVKYLEGKSLKFQPRRVLRR